MISIHILPGATPSGSLGVWWSIRTELLETQVGPSYPKCGVVWVGVGRSLQPQLGNVRNMWGKGVRIEPFEPEVGMILPKKRTPWTMFHGGVHWFLTGQHCSGSTFGRKQCGNIADLSGDTPHVYAKHMSFYRRAVVHEVLFLSTPPTVAVVAGW